MTASGEMVTGPAYVTGSALLEAARAVIAEDRIAPVMEFLEPVLGAAVAPLGLSAELTGAAVARALACAAAHAYVFTDPGDTALLNQLDPDAATSENPLETLNGQHEDYCLIQKDCSSEAMGQFWHPTGISGSRGD